MIDETTTPIVYVDANPFIYFIDGEDSVASHLRPFFDILRHKPAIATTSELTLAEVLPKARPDTRSNYFNLIVWSGLVRLQPITREILVDTAEYRQRNQRVLVNGRKVMLKLPDAIHIVTAARTRCRAFLSADRDLRLPPGIAMFEPNEAGLSSLMRELQ